MQAKYVARRAGMPSELKQSSLAPRRKNGEDPPNLTLKAVRLAGRTNTYAATHIHSNWAHSMGP